MENVQVELRIRGVSIEGGDPFVVLESRATARRLLVPVGAFEASAIILELECVSPPRPLTHALLADFFLEGGFVLDRVELSGESGDCSRAKIVYRKGLRRLEKELRPSDALALALRLEAPVFAEPELLDSQEAAGPWRRPRILDLGDWKAKALRA